MAQNNLHIEKKRLIISTKNDTFTKINGFIPIQQCLSWEIFKFILSNSYDKLLDDENFRTYMSSIVDNIYNPDSDFNFSDEEKNKIRGVIIDTDFYKSRFLQNANNSIWVIPILNETFNKNNIDYIENFISCASSDEYDVYLLLHDKDLFRETKCAHQVSDSDKDSFGINYNEFPPLLKERIEKNKTFVFKHQRDEDSYCRLIVWNKNLSSLSISSIIETLTLVVDNLKITDSINKQLCKNKMEEEFCKATEKRSYDFSVKFLD